MEGGGLWGACPTECLNYVKKVEKRGKNIQTSESSIKFLFSYYFHDFLYNFVINLFSCFSVRAFATNARPFVQNYSIIGPKGYNWFPENGSFSVHSMNTIYASIPEYTAS